MNEKLSVITASYNYADLIKETVESVINQTYQNWEMIIIDDGSKDNSVEVIKKYCEKDERIKFYQHEGGANKGLAETLKLGLSKAKNDWIIFLESDDRLKADYMEKKIDIINKYPDVKFIFNDVNLFGEEEKIKEYKKYFDKFYKIVNNTVFPANFKKYLGKVNYIPTFSCVMLKKEITDNFDFNPLIEKALDWHLWSQAACKNDFFYINEKLTDWRIHKNSYNNIPTQSIYEYLYFLNFQIRNNLRGGKYKFMSCLNFLKDSLNVIRKNLLQLHINKKEISLKILNKQLFKLQTNKDV